MSGINLKNNNILFYFLISSLNPRKKIFELINTNDSETYIEAQEILANYINANKAFELERAKIKSRNNSFHIFITNEKLIFISYSNKKLFSSEKNFALFDEINNYLVKNLKGRIIGKQSFLIEDEKEEIKDIINKNIEDIISIKSFDSFLDSAETEKENEKEMLQVEIKNNIINEENSGTFDINNKNIIIKKNSKNNSRGQLNELTDKALNDKGKKNESSGEEIIKNINNKNPSVPLSKSDKLNNMVLKNDYKNSKLKISSKTLIGSHSKLKNKIFEGDKFNNIKKTTKIIKNQNLKKTYNYNKYNYNNLNLKKNKPDSCSKTFIISILISVIVLQIVAIPLIINIYDFSV